MNADFKYRYLNYDKDNLLMKRQLQRGDQYTDMYNAGVLCMSAVTLKAAVVPLSCIIFPTDTYNV